jgi:hypothetical protein
LIGPVPPTIRRPGLGVPLSGISENVAEVSRYLGTTIPSRVCELLYISREAFAFRGA